MREFVECIFTNVRAEHLQADNGEAVVGTNMLEVLAIFLVETEPSPRVLEVVLNALLPESKHDNPAAFDLAKELLHRCEDTAAEPVCSCLRMLLAGGGRDDQFSDSELSESIIPDARAPLDRPSRAADVRTRRRARAQLIYELHKIGSGYVKFVLPLICERLQEDDARVARCAPPLASIVVTHAEERGSRARARPRLAGSDLAARQAVLDDAHRLRLRRLVPEGRAPPRLSRPLP